MQQGCAQSSVSPSDVQSTTSVALSCFVACPFLEAEQRGKEYCAWMWQVLRAPSSGNECKSSMKCELCLTFGEPSLTL